MLAYRLLYACSMLALCLLMGLSWVSHGSLMGLSWISLCEPYLQGHEFAVIITCDHKDFCLSAIGQHYDDNMPLS